MTKIRIPAVGLTLCAVAAVVITLACLVGGCSRPDKVPSVPRRTAYPRVMLYDTVYRDVDSLPLRLEVNAAATTHIEHRPDGNIWLNVDYPAYGAVVNYTLQPVNRRTLISAIANRRDRIRLNINNIQPDFEAFDSQGDYAVQLLTTPSVMATPLQFLAANPDHPKWLVSGAAYFTALPPTARPDSLAPIVNALHRDIAHSLYSLSDK